MICFDSSAFIIQAATEDVEDKTWIFLLTIHMSLNTILWTISYPEVRQTRPKKEVEDLVEEALGVLDRCSERWPSSKSTSHLYDVLSKACLQSYEARGTPGLLSASSLTTPLSFAEPTSPPDAYAQSVNSQQSAYVNAPHFGHVFDSPPASMNAYAFDPNFPPPQPSFRSNSIFCAPATDPSGRRFSYFPPDYTQTWDHAPDDPTPPATATPEQHFNSPPQAMAAQLPTPPASLHTGNLSAAAPSSTLSPPSMTSHASPVETALATARTNMSPPQKPEPPQTTPTFSIATRRNQPAPAQRPLPAPTPIVDWFSPPPPFISPYTFGNMGNNFVNNNVSLSGNYNGFPGANNVFQNMGGPQFDDYDMERQGSLSHSQQLELMGVLEKEGMGDLNAFLNGSVFGTDTTRW